tara:strand:+ start:3692 stop:4249 length:558 start_codon:yes stop_codon:yes gene_type:complete
MAQLMSIPEAARRYANAVFELAAEQQILEVAINDLSKIDQLISNNSDFARLITTPTFSVQEQIAVIEKIFEKDNVHDLVKNLIRLLVQNRRINILSAVIGGFKLLVQEHSGEINAEITTACDLTEKQVSQIKSNLKGIIGKEVKLDINQDPNILGGIVVKIGSQMIDTSVSTKLNNLKILMKGAS